MSDSAYFSTLNPNVQRLPESGIVEVMNAGWDIDGLIPLWAGEGHLPTPDFICEAANQSMRNGETFYTWQCGIPELRAALARYHAGLYEKPFEDEQFFVTGSGMQAIQIALQALAEPGSEIIVPTPAWPNFEAAATVAGITTVEVPMRFGNRGWQIDLQRIADAVTSKTRVLFINSPSNPTGWTADLETLRDIRDLARERGIWIVADEVYNRFYFGADRAPSFYDVLEEGDRILFVNTFSKNWAMTGWRVGWISAPASLGQVFENLIQYSTSGVAAFMQRAAVAALERGEDFLKSQVSTAAISRNSISTALAETGRIQFHEPEGAFYLFFTIDGITDSRGITLRLLREARIGLAPGTAFGAGGEPFFRLCFARNPEDMAEVGDRLNSWLRKNL
ncbi:MAG: pyridoxal phosphate-dependent aminotransferase [Pseudomonadota bacterium]